MTMTLSIKKHPGVYLAHPRKKKTLHPYYSGPPKSIEPFYNNFVICHKCKSNASEFYVNFQSETARVIELCHDCKSFVGVQVMNEWLHLYLTSQMEEKWPKV